MGSDMPAREERELFLRGEDVLRTGSDFPRRRSVHALRPRPQAPGHIAGLSDDVLADTPLANARALVDEARRR